MIKNMVMGFCFLPVINIIKDNSFRILYTDKEPFSVMTGRQFKVVGSLVSFQKFTDNFSFDFENK